MRKIKFKGSIYLLKESEKIYSYQEKSLNPRFQKQMTLINELTISWEEALELQKKLEEFNQYFPRKHSRES